MTKKYEKPITKHCVSCGKPFTVKVSYVKFLKEKRGLDVAFCSRQCFGEHKKRPLPIEIVDMYNSDLSSGDIAKIYNVSAAHVRNELKRYGIELKHKGYYVKNGIKNPTLNVGHSGEAIAKIKEARRRQFGTPENESQQMSEWAIARIVKGRTGKAYNKLETALSCLIEKAGFNYTQQYRLGRFVFDFYLPESNTLIEVHGTYWHADPRFYNRETLYPSQANNIANDARKRQKAIDSGFKFLTFWEHDIYNTPQQIITELQNI